MPGWTEPPTIEAEYEVKSESRKQSMRALLATILRIPWLDPMLRLDAQKMMGKLG